MGALKEFVRQWPGAYSRLHRTYYRGLFAAERLVGTRLQEAIWRRRAGGSREELLTTVAHPHRAYLLHELAKWAPFESVLEVGCNAGPNLLLLAERFPQARLTGVDINSRFIEAGRTLMAEKGVTNVALSVGAADDLSVFPSKSFDVTFTDATLMYVGPDKIGRALMEIVRVTRNAVVLNEWHMTDNGGQLSLWYYLHWVHDFPGLFAGIVPERPVSVKGLPRELWGADGWREFGALVEVSLR